MARHKHLELLVTAENFDRIAEFKGDDAKEVEGIFVASFAISEHEGKPQYIERVFRRQQTVENFQRLVEMAGGIFKGVHGL